jgi:hypothetical protein
MKLVAASLAVAVAVGLAPLQAWADGDPASDYLLGQNVFLPFDVKIPAAKGNQLAQLLANAKRAGFPIRVAVIGTRYDMGSVTVLYGKPKQYARFLGTELKFVYRGRLLVVMPNGFGYSVGGRTAPSRPIAGLAPPGRDGTKLANSAITAVQRLAAANGIRLALPKAKPMHTANRDRVIIAAGALTGIALIGGWMLVRRLRVPSAT